MYEDYDFDNSALSTYNISVDKWNEMTPDEQEVYIKDNNIKVYYTHDISDKLQRGFGQLHEWGYWEYTCKIIK